LGGKAEQHHDNGSSDGSQNCLDHFVAKLEYEFYQVLIYYLTGHENVQNLDAHCLIDAVDESPQRLQPIAQQSEELLCMPRPCITSQSFYLEKNNDLGEVSRLSKLH